MHALPVLFRIAVKQRILVARLHLGLGRHLHLPPLDGRRRHALLCERGVDALDEAVDAAQALAVAVLLHARHAPGDFPAGTLVGCVCVGGGTKYQRRPPLNGCVGRRKPNIALGVDGDWRGWERVGDGWEMGEW